MEKEYRHRDLWTWGIMIATLCVFGLGGCKSKGAGETKTTPRPSGEGHQSEDGILEGTAGEGATEETHPTKKAPSAKTFSEDKEIKTDSGLSFVVPAGWFFTRRDSYMEFQDPEKGMWMAILEVDSDDGEGAIKKAWSVIRENFDMKEDKTVKPPVAGSGWDEVVQTNYITPSKDRRLVLAVAYTKGNKSYVALVDGKIHIIAKRGAQMNTLLSSLKAPGVEKESFAGKSAHTLDKAKLAELEKFIEETRKKTNIVGTAVGIVQGGKVVYKKGFGVRKLGGRKSVTPKTLFMIGSMTKSLTSMMMAKLVDEGKFKWDTPAKDVYPEFGLGDESAAAKCTMQHTVCACTGMPRQDMEFLFEFDGKTAETRMKLLKTMKPTTGFGETFQYSNLLVAAGGYMSGHAAYPKLTLRRAYRKAINNYLFKPAKMRNTIFRMDRVRRMNHAQPHARKLNNDFVSIPLSYEETVVSVGPAGGAWSNVEDMLNYVSLELGRGKAVTGKRIVSKDNVIKRWQPQSRMSEKSHYGLALVIEKSRGLTILSHGGGTLGFSSYMFFLPEHDVGMVVLTNGQGGGVLTQILKRRLLEVLFDGEQKAEKNLNFVLTEMKKRNEDVEKRIENKINELWIKSFIGDYRNDSLGEIKLLLKKGKLFMDAGEWKSPVVKYKTKDGATKLLIGEPLAGLPFTPGVEGDVKTLTLHTGQQQYVFKKR